MQRRGSGGSNYGEFEATALFCEHCRQAQPVRAHLLTCSWFSCASRIPNALADSRSEATVRGA